MKFIKIALLIVAVIGASAYLWYTQPWADYSPAKIASLEDPEKLTWNMQNMRELVPSAEVATGSPYQWTENNQPLELNYTFTGKTHALEDFLERSTTAGLMVVKSGEIVHEQYRQGANTETLFTSWSVAKSFVATGIAIAVKEGVIGSFDDLAEQYAPQFAGTDYGATKISELLAMSSGINFIENYADGESDVRPFFFDSFILGKNPDLLLKPFERSRAPMSDLDYISSNSHVLSAVLRGAYGQPLAKIMSEKLWQPLGMSGDANWLLHRDDEQGQALGYCCLNSRLRDYARFGLFYLNALNELGVGAEKLPAGWAQSLKQPATNAHQPGGDKYSGRGYSQHFWLPIKAPGVFFAAGIYGQYIWIDQANDLVIVRTSADPEWTARYRESEAVFKAITEYFN